tara:strand:+ start:4488 stop:4940 length:453 start_codon:yes stop_codon:yes gene_type:complete
LKGKAKLTLKTKKDFALQASNIFNAMTHSFNDKEKAETIRFFLSTITSRIATTFIMSHYLSEQKITPSKIYNTLSPIYGSKSSFVNYVALGKKRGYLLLRSNKDDRREKYLYPSPAFIKIWCIFLAKTKGTELSSDIDWNSIINTADKVS